MPCPNPTKYMTTLPTLTCQATHLPTVFNPLIRGLSACCKPALTHIHLSYPNLLCHMSTSFAPSCSTAYLAASIPTWTASRLPVWSSTYLIIMFLSTHSIYKYTLHCPLMNYMSTCCAKHQFISLQTYTATHLQFIPTSLATCLYP